MILAGDIGATKTILGLFSTGSDPADPLTEATYPSTDYANLEDMVSEFLLTTEKGPLEAACFGVAGPVKTGRAKVTNLPWSLEVGSLTAALGIPHVKLINDLEAVANAVPLLRPSDLKTLNTGIPDQKGTRAVIAPGTGLGEAFLTWGGQRWYSHPTEGSHTDFSPANDDQIELLQYLRRTIGHVSWELVCSGIGIPNIVLFLKDSGRYEVPSWLGESIGSIQDIIPIIVDKALNEAPPCPLCIETLRLFVSILGAESGNLALKVLATGGIYIGGGIPPRIMPLLETDDFIKSFTAKGRMTGILKEIPVHVILNTRAAFMGAAMAGLEMTAIGTGE